MKNDKETAVALLLDVFLSETPQADPSDMLFVILQNMKTRDDISERHRKIISRLYNFSIELEEGNISL